MDYEVIVLAAYPQDVLILLISIGSPRVALVNEPKEPAMKKATILFFSCLLCFGIVEFSFSKKREQQPLQSIAARPIDQWYTAQADTFLLQLLLLQKNYTTKARLPLFQKQFIKVRLAFKQMETLVSYFDIPVYLSLNSRVKPEVELYKGVFEYVQQPHGLQVIESFLEDDSIFMASRPQLKDELEMAIRTATFLKTHHFTIPYSDTGFLNAIKAETIRLAALGVTGFDKPVLDDAIPETDAALNGIQQLLGVYQNANPALAQLKKISFQVSFARQFIKTNYTGFNSFDRLTFIRKYLQPIFALADMLTKQQSDTNLQTPGFKSFFQKGYIDELYHRTKTYPAEMVALGKSLFESNTLSANGELSCTSCHKPSLAFADTVQRNTGLSLGDTVMRNTPGLFNAKYHLRFQWDGHALFMQDQFREVLSSHIEMGNISEPELLRRLKADADLKSQFQLVFGVPVEGITFQLTLNALEAFVHSLVDVSSAFDKYMTYKTTTISPSVKRGFNLFMGAGKCGTCHFMPLFNGVMPPYANKEDNEVIGVLKDDDFDNPVLDSDLGLFAITKQELHRNAFKVPGLRNLKKTAPYMHNGSLKNLDDLLIFYNVGGGGGWGFGLDVPNQSLEKEPLRLSEKERRDLKAFLLSLD